MNVLEEKLYICKLIAVVKNSMLQTNRKIYVNGRKSDAFVYILSGSCTYTMDGQSLIACQGDVLYLSNRSVYTMKLQSEKYEFIYVDFLFEDKQQNFDCSVFSCKNGGEILFHKLYRTYKNGESENFLTSMRYLYEIYDLLYKNNKFFYLQGTLREKIEKAKEYIDGHYGNADLSITTLSNRLGMSEVYFRKIFLTAYKISPKKYIVSVRITKARELLQYSVLSLKECATLCGFSSSQYFSKVFKKETGETPASYLRRIK